MTRVTLFVLMIIVGVLMPMTSKEATTNGVKLTIKISGIETKTGQLIISVFENQADFKSERPTKSYTLSKTNAKNGYLQTTIALTAGVYGIVVLDDANSNKKMDYSGLLPKEGFGFSGYYHKGLLRPTFSDFDFRLTSAASVAVKMKYM